MYCIKCGKKHGGPGQYCPECASPQGDAKPPTKGKGLSIASMVLGICGVGLLALIFGIIALAQRRAGRGMATAGVVLGSIPTFLVLIALFFVLGARGGATSKVPPVDVAKFTSAMEGRLQKLEGRMAKVGASRDAVQKVNEEIVKTRALMQEMAGMTNASQTDLHAKLLEVQKAYSSARKVFKDAGGHDADER